MYGWGNGPKRRPAGTADADNPSPATIERRRLSDIDFLDKIRAAKREDLLSYSRVVKGWRLIAVTRRLAKFNNEEARLNEEVTTAIIRAENTEAGPETMAKLWQRVVDCEQALVDFYGLSDPFGQIAQDGVVSAREKVNELRKKIDLSS